MTHRSRGRRVVTRRKATDPSFDRNGLPLLLVDVTMMIQPACPHDLGFTYQVRKNGAVEIFHHGRLAATLRGQVAEEFQQEVHDESSPDAQQAMARITGNYRRGNERDATRHDRNRR